MTWYDLIGEEGDSTIGEPDNFYLGTNYVFSLNVNPGDTYKVRVRAHNLHGWGEWSSTSIILSTGVPDKPDPPATIINNLNIKVSWQDPPHNFEAIDRYQILFKHKTGDGFSEEIINCDGTNQIIFIRKTCEIPVALFISNDYNFKLEAGDLVIVKVAAHNSNGWGEFSDVNVDGAIIETVPGVMVPPTRNSETNILQIVVDWDPPVNDGYSEIVSYNLQWDSGTDGTTWSNLIGFNTDSLAQTFTVAQGVAFGDEYHFKVRARNYWGWSDFSSELVIKSATYPEVMLPLTTLVDEATGDVKILWVAPYDNEQTITAYEILVLNKAGDQWIEDVTNCDGSTQEIVSQRYCQVPMQVLKDAPYNLEYRELIVAKARAYNVYGWQTTYSTANVAGITIRREPSQVGLITVNQVGTTTA